MSEHAAISTILKIGNNKVKQMDNTHTLQPEDYDDTKEAVFIPLNISGQSFIISSKLLKDHPDCNLAQPSFLKPSWADHLDAYFFDRDPQLFNSVLNLLRYRTLQVPNGYSSDMLNNELQFWKVAHTESEGSVENEEYERLEKEFIWIEQRIPPPEATASKLRKFRYQMWATIMDPMGPHTYLKLFSLIYAIFSISVLFIYMVFLGMSTDMNFREVKRGFSDKFNLTYVMEVCESRIECFISTEPILEVTIMMKLLGAIMAVETFLKILSCPDYKVFVKGVGNWIDLLTMLAMIVFYILMLSQPSHAIAVAELFTTSVQVLRVLKIVQYVNLLDGLKVLLLTLKGSWKELFILSMYLVCAMFFYSTLVTFTEIMTGEKNSGIPDALTGYWWAIITMTTVGYGDYYPVTLGGYLFGILTSLTGLIMTALPVAVIGSNFNVYWEHNTERNKRNRIQLSTINLREKVGDMGNNPKTKIAFTTEKYS